MEVLIQSSSLLTQTLTKARNHDELDDYFKSSPYTCFMSEYNAPFKSIMEIEKLSLMNNTKAIKKVAFEKLFINY